MQPGEQPGQSIARDEDGQCRTHVVNGTTIACEMAVVELSLVADDARELVIKERGRGRVPCALDVSALLIKASLERERPHGGGGFADTGVAEVV